MSVSRIESLRREFEKYSAPSLPALENHTEVTRKSLESVANEIVELLLAKNADYGNAWEKHGLAGISIRISDKGLRLETLSDGREVLVVDERIEDTLRDIAGYAILGLLKCNSKKQP